MHYTIIAEDGNDVAMTNMALARDFLTDRTGHPIVRMANQSIFADMLQASTCMSSLLSITPSEAHTEVDILLVNFI